MLMVELGWVSVLLFWSQQTALNDDGEADSWAAPATAAVVAAAEDAVLDTLERSPSQEMRVLLVTASCSFTYQIRLTCTHAAIYYATAVPGWPCKDRTCEAGCTTS